MVASIENTGDDSVRYQVVEGMIDTYNITHDYCNTYANIGYEYGYRIIYKDYQTENILQFK